MSEEIILRSKKPPIEIPLKSVGEVLWEKLQELNKDSTCIVSKLKKNFFQNQSTKKTHSKLLFDYKIEAKSGTKLTVKELISQANSIAVALIKRGIIKSDRICIFSLIDINFTVISFAAYFLGIAFVPFSPTIVAHELKNYIKS
jgi:long-subunit acyl-CoA synthetase (AMP-forming)